MQLNVHYRGEADPIGWLADVRFRGGVGVSIEELTEKAARSRPSIIKNTASSGRSSAIWTSHTEERNLRQLLIWRLAVKSIQTWKYKRDGEGLGLNGPTPLCCRFLASCIAQLPGAQALSSDIEIFLCQYCTCAIFSFTDLWLLCSFWSFKDWVSGLKKKKPTHPGSELE